MSTLSTLIVAGVIALALGGGLWWFVNRPLVTFLCEDCQWYSEARSVYRLVRKACKHRCPDRERSDT